MSPTVSVRFWALILRWAGPGVDRRARAALRGPGAYTAGLAGPGLRVSPYCPAPWARLGSYKRQEAAAPPETPGRFRENFAHHWPTRLRDARLDRPSSWGLGCQTGAGRWAQSLGDPRGKQRHMLHQYKVSGCLKELSAETPCEIMALSGAGARRKDGCSSSGRAPPVTWPRWRHKHRATPQSGGDQSTHPPLRRK
jgi:hypothetical protein